MIKPKGAAAQAGKPKPESPEGSEEKDILHEIMESYGHVLDAEEKGLDMLARYHLKTSFRNIGLRALWGIEPVLNKTKDLRGMVTSKKGRVAFELIREKGEFVGHFAKFVSIASEAWDLHKNYMHMLESDMSISEKIDHSRDYAASVTARVIASTYLDAGKLAVWTAGHVFKMNTARAEDNLAHLTTTVRDVTDPDNIHKIRIYVQSHLHLPFPYSELL